MKGLLGFWSCRVQLLGLTAKREEELPETRPERSEKSSAVQTGEHYLIRSLSTPLPWKTCRLSADMQEIDIVFLSRQQRIRELQDEIELQRVRVEHVMEAAHKYGSRKARKMLKEEVCKLARLEEMLKKEMENAHKQKRDLL